MVKITIPCKTFSQSIRHDSHTLPILHDCTLYKLHLSIIDRYNQRLFIGNAVYIHIAIINIDRLLRTAKTLYEWM